LIAQYYEYYDVATETLFLHIEDYFCVILCFLFLFTLQKRDAIKVLHVQNSRLRSNTETISK